MDTGESFNSDLTLATNASYAAGIPYVEIQNLVGTLYLHGLWLG